MPRLFAAISAGQIVGVFIAGTLALVLPESLPATGPPDGFVVVAHSSRPYAPLSRSELAAVFMGDVKRWADGAEVVPIDQSATSPVRETFSRAVLDRPVDAVLNHWQRQILAGRGVPPPVVKRSDREVIDAVARNPRAIGYVSASAALDEGVRVVALVD